MKQAIDAKKLLDLLKGDKKRMIIVVIAALGIILIVISSFITDDKEAPKAQSEQQTQSFDEREYAAQLESKLEAMISTLSGAGKTKVMVTIDCDYETVYAKNGSLSQDDSSSDEKSEYIIIDSEEKQGGLLLRTVTPRVRGVAVACEGGNLPEVESSITELLAAVLDVGTNHISVSKIK